MSALVVCLSMPNSCVRILRTRSRAAVGWNHAGDGEMVAVTNRKESDAHPLIALQRRRHPCPLELRKLRTWVAWLSTGEEARRQFRQIPVTPHKLGRPGAQRMRRRGHVGPTRSSAERNQPARCRLRVFTPDMRYFRRDLDHCRDGHRSGEPWAIESSRSSTHTRDLSEPAGPPSHRSWFDSLPRAASVRTVI